ncbi:hypothetical protein SAMN05444392_10794 [Seinonella peptonophila]|uniref:CAAX prenyl protease 2/Lysostaphin resistance protein A-like domain-containing protein n=1 Tax=Seinonella peptonophila TaxID=112248 RepID=A0A1M4YRM2_9BACL|nr:type II CAAX endopeptidase family protein [Seinonella peptonophila]SHF08162.1 hypothetical protein SAMN05444392_10794 [Seinonella peptonophila]
MIQFILIHILFLYLLIIEPWWGKKSYQKFIFQVKQTPTKRFALYIRWGAILWGITLYFFMISYLYQIKIDWWHSFDGFPLYLVIGSIVGSFVPILLAFINEPFRKRMVLQLELYQDFLPATTKDKWGWAFLSFSAGFCEELLFRVYLLYLFLDYWHIPIWLAILFSTIIFGMAHWYQGWRGVIVTSMLGFLLAVIFVWTKSIVVCMILHFLIDIRLLAFLKKSRHS